MASTAGHRENILNPDIENMAVAFGTYNDDFKYYWVQEFKTDRYTDIVAVMKCITFFTAS